MKYMNVSVWAYKQIQRNLKHGIELAGRGDQADHATGQRRRGGHGTQADDAEGGKDRWCSNYEEGSPSCTDP